MKIALGVDVLTSARAIGHASAMGRAFRSARNRADPRSGRPLCLLPVTKGKTPRRKPARRFGVYLGFAASETGALLMMRIGDAIPKLFDAVMCLLHTRCLTLNEHAALCVEFRFVERRAIIGDSRIFTTFTFRENRMRFIRTHGGFQIDPAAMQRATDRAVLVGIAAQGAHPLL